MKKQALLITGITAMLLLVASPALSNLADPRDEEIGRVIEMVTVQGTTIVTLKKLAGNVTVQYLFPPDSAANLAKLTQACPHPGSALYIQGYNPIRSVKCVTWAQIGSQPGPDEPYWDWPSTPVSPTGDAGDGNGMIDQGDMPNPAPGCNGGAETFTGSGGIVNGNLRIGDRFDILEIPEADADPVLREAVRTGKTVTVTYCHGEAGEIDVQSFSVAK